MQPGWRLAEYRQKREGGWTVVVSCHDIAEAVLTGVLL